MPKKYITNAHLLGPCQKEDTQKTNDQLQTYTVPDRGDPRTKDVQRTNCDHNPFLSWPEDTQRLIQLPPTFQMIPRKLVNKQEPVLSTIKDTLRTDQRSQTCSNPDRGYRENCTAGVFSTLS